MFTPSQPPKLPQRPLRLPHVVAAHERHRSALIMKSMTRKALYAQTPEGYTPAWTELESVPRRGIWTLIRAFTQRAIRFTSTRDGEDLIRRALEENVRRVRFYEESVWVYDPNEAVHETIGISRHEYVAEISPRSVVSAGWTVAARGAHSRMSVHS